MQLGVKEVTVYAFSIENFKRGKEEVETLMGLAKQKLHQLSLKNQLLEKHGLKLEILGDTSLLPLDVQISFASVVHKTKHHSK